MGEGQAWFLRRTDLRLFGVLLINFVLFGISVTIVGATVPKIIREFGWTYFEMGLVISAAPVGYLLWTFASGLLVYKLGPRIVLVSGLLLQAAGLALFGIRKGAMPNVVMTLLMGLGQGSTETVTNFCVTRMEVPGRSRLMNLMHAAFPIGAVSGPLTLGLLITTGHAWQQMYRGLAFLTLMMAVVLLQFSFERPHGTGESLGRLGLSHILQSPMLILLSFVMFLFVGAEMGISAWVAEYFVRIFGSSTSFGAWMVSAFWLGVLLGRASLSVAYHGTQQQNVLFALGCTSAVFMTSFLLVREIAIGAIILSLCGLSLSAVYPLVMAIVGYRFGENQSVAIGTVGMAGGLGSFSFPLIMASMVGDYGISSGFWFCVCATLPAVLLTWFIRNKVTDIRSMKVPGITELE